MKKIYKYLIILFIPIVVIFIILPSNIKIIHSIEILDDNSNSIYYEINGKYRSWVSLDNVDKNFIEMLIHIEDKNYYNHFGFSLSRIIKSTYNNIFKNKMEGASTITQQYSRTLFLNNKKNLLRKIMELYYSVSLELKYDKNSVLEGYINNVYFGNNLYGIKNAAKYYFDTSPDNLTISQSAILIGLINGPIKYSPIKNYSKSLLKRKQTLDILLDDNIINNEEYENAINEKINIKYGNPNELSSNLLFYKDQVLNELKSLNITKKGIKIYTSYNQDINNFISNIKFNDLEHAIILSDSNNGNIICMIGGNDYYKSGYNRCHSKRQIGSLVKPFLYYQALNYGYTPLSTHKSEKTSFLFGKIEYNPSNYKDRYQNRDITMLEALASSDNIYAVKTYLDFSPDLFKENMDNFNISSSLDISNSLGSNDESLFNMVKSYSAFSSLGKDINLSTINSVYQNKKKIYEKNHPMNKYDKGYCYVVNHLLKYTFDSYIKYSTASNIADNYTINTMAKSGSTSYDSWFIGFNPDVTLGIWSGYDDNSNIYYSDSKIIYKYIMDYYIKKNGISVYDIPKTVYKKNVNINNYYTDVYFRNEIPTV